MSGSFTRASLLAVAAAVGLAWTGPAWAESATQPMVVRPVNQIGFGAAPSAYGYGDLAPASSDFSFYQPFLYGYSFYRPHSGFYYQPRSQAGVYRPFYYSPGFYPPGFSARYFRGAPFPPPHPGVGACGAYGYRAGTYGH